MAWSILHNGPGMKSINKELFMIMCGQKPDLTTFDLNNFLENDLAEKLAKVVRCSTTEELTELKNSLGDWICDCGVPNIFTAFMSDLPTIYWQLVTHFIYHRVASIIQQFTSGLNSCGRLWEVVLNNWKAFLPLFTNTRGALTRNEVRDLFDIVWSSTGSNRRDLEEETIFLWECWLMSIQDSVPPLGFQQKCKVEFYDQEEPTRRIPYASTCALTLYLPRGVSEEEDFKELMFLAINGSLGFGKKAMEHSQRTKRRKIAAKVAEHFRLVSQQNEFEEQHFNLESTYNEPLEDSAYHDCVEDVTENVENEYPTDVFYDALDNDIFYDGFENGMADNTSDFDLDSECSDSEHAASDTR
ncbi:uncharacterized protein LOC143742419 [Siphateles boraxobius]|uniref:uncharacterized protein LOC143742419 n=1 Tax=Siphateles boraxobius TaxID=180520 RepID=UPI0040636E73